MASSLAPLAGAADACPSYLEWLIEPDAGKPPDGLPNNAAAHLDPQATRAANKPDTCCYNWHLSCPGGRPLLAIHGPVRAGAASRADWSAGRGAGVAMLDPDARAALAASWLEDALDEHASVASFARAALELLAVGAPPQLVAGCQRAALDEIHHAQICFGLASRYAGRDLGPGPLPAVPPRAPDLAALAVDTFLEGCVGETAAALAASRALEGCEDKAARAALAVLNEDEARHAALAWSTLAWALESGGERVVRALADVASRRPTVAAAPSANSLERFGRLTHAEKLLAADDAWTAVTEPMLRELLDRAARATTVGRTPHRAAPR